MELEQYSGTDAQESTRTYNVEVSCEHTFAYRIIVVALTMPASVPLDHFNASAGTARIALARYRAPAKSRKGIVLVNPGGPGSFLSIVF